MSEVSDVSPSSEHNAFSLDVLVSRWGTSTSIACGELPENNRTCTNLAGSDTRTQLLNSKTLPSWTWRSVHLLSLLTWEWQDWPGCAGPLLNLSNCLHNFGRSADPAIHGASTVFVYLYLSWGQPAKSQVHPSYQKFHTVHPDVGNTRVRVPGGEVQAGPTPGDTALVITVIPVPCKYDGPVRFSPFISCV